MGWTRTWGGGRGASRIDADDPPMGRATSSVPGILHCGSAVDQGSHTWNAAQILPLSRLHQLGEASGPAASSKAMDSLISYSRGASVTHVASDRVWVEVGLVFKISSPSVGHNSCMGRCPLAPLLEAASCSVHYYLDRVVGVLHLTAKQSTAQHSRLGQGRAGQSSQIIS